MRYFTLPEAQRALPEVERHLLCELCFYKTESQKAQEHMDRTSDHVRSSGGARSTVQVRRCGPAATPSISASRLGMQIHEAGVVVWKDLDIGLLDFMDALS